MGWWCCSADFGKHDKSCEHYDADKKIAELEAEIERLEGVYAEKWAECNAADSLAMMAITRAEKAEAKLEQWRQDNRDLLLQNTKEYFRAEKAEAEVERLKDIIGDSLKPCDDCPFEEGR